MTTDHTATRHDVGKRYAVARYDRGRRVIVAQRIDGRTQVTDVSLTRGRSYLIEPDVAGQDELQALVDDYLAKARQLGHCPMIPGRWWVD